MPSELAQLKYNAAVCSITEQFKKGKSDGDDGLARALESINIIAHYRDGLSPPGVNGDWGGVLDVYGGYSCYGAVGYALSRAVQADISLPVPLRDSLKKAAHVLQHPD